MKNKIWLVFLIVPLSFSLSAQSISSSPYSMYGLGSLYDSNFGPITSMGSSGIAMPSESFINNRNPASLSFIKSNSFLFDVGGKGIVSIYENSSLKESKNNFQFSHIAFAFPLTSSSGLSVSLQPFSSATYQIVNLELPIEQSGESYFLNAYGKGGLNNFDASYGFKAGKKASFGITASFIFGNIEDDRFYSIANSVTNINKSSDYKGLRFTLGTQYAIDSAFTFGATIKTPSRISATKVESLIIQNNYGSLATETDASSAVDPYFLPLEIGIGLKKDITKTMMLTFDYERAFWNSAEQSSLYGKYSNQDKFGLGFSFRKTGRMNSYFDRIHYYAGINYDTGFLEIDGQKINSAALSIGLGFPLERTKSFLNISYSYGQKGKITSDLIKENYHKVGINLSLEGIWFVKRKYE